MENERRMTGQHAVVAQGWASCASISSAHLSEIHVERLEHQTEMVSMHEVGEQMDDVFLVVRIVGGQQFEIFELLLAGFVHGLIAADQLDDEFAALCARRAVGAGQQLAHTKHRAEHTRTLQTAHAVATALQQIAKTVAVVALRTETEQQTTRKRQKRQETGKGEQI